MQYYCNMNKINSTFATLLHLCASRKSPYRLQNSTASDFQQPGSSCMASFKWRYRLSSVFNWGWFVYIWTRPWLWSLPTWAGGCKFSTSFVWNCLFFNSGRISLFGASWLLFECLLRTKWQRPTCFIGSHQRLIQILSTGFLSGPIGIIGINSLSKSNFH